MYLKYKFNFCKISALIILWLSTYQSCVAKNLLHFIDYFSLNGEYRNYYNLYTDEKLEAELIKDGIISLNTGTSLSSSEKLGIELSFTPENGFRYYPETDNKKKFTEVKYKTRSIVIDYYNNFVYNGLNCYVTAGLGGSGKKIESITQFGGTEENNEEEGQDQEGEDNSQNSNKGKNILNNKNFDNFSLLWQIGGGFTYNLTSSTLIYLGYRFKKHHNLLHYSGSEELEEPLKSFNNANLYEHNFHFGITIKFNNF